MRLIDSNSEEIKDLEQLLEKLFSKQAVKPPTKIKKSIFFRIYQIEKNQKNFN